jgi:hypothetical protein
MDAEFDPEELSLRYPEFRRLWDQFQEAKTADDALDTPVIFRDLGQGYRSGRAVPTKEYSAIKERLKHARRALV